MTERVTDRDCRYVGSVTWTSGASVGTDGAGVHPKLRSEGRDIVTAMSDETVLLFA